MEILNSIFYFVIIIGVLVVIHEFGHFLAGRLSGMRIDVFSVGMGHRLFGWNKTKGFTFGSLSKDFDGNGFCDYRLSMFPIGGYVKISGMVDESMDAEFINKEPQPWEFRSKGTLAKAFTISAGVIMNAMLAILIFGGITYFEGQSFRDTTRISYVDHNSASEKLGFLPGDKILKVNNENIESWEDCIDKLVLKNFGSSCKVVISRNNKDTVLEIDGSILAKSFATERTIGINPDNSTIYLEGIESSLPAAKVGLQAGDTLLTVNGKQIVARTQVKDVISTSGTQAINLTWKRGNQVFADSLHATSDGIIGVYFGEKFDGNIITKNYGIFESIASGFNESVRSIELFYSSMKQIFIGNIAIKQAIGGPIMIAKQASKQAEMGLVYFLHFMALLSITLAIINILPIPALDGGHLVFIIIEGIIRREVSIKVKMAFQQVGMIIMFLLMGLALFNDLIR